jgi:hypothetical protein
MITFQIDREAHRVTCEVTTSIRVLDVGFFMEQLFADPAFDSSQNICVVVDEDTVAPDLIARNALAGLLLSWRKLHASASVALVLPGIAWRRIAAQLIENYGLEARNVRCFVNKPDAYLWLQETAIVPATTATNSSPS